ncbi:kinase-like domain-containing protein [Amanita rubescens]|nr:kinase-like domain-containing protein [Amanita rubescens]
MDPPIIHGNFRAEKVFIGDEGQPLISDFALAKFDGNLITQVIHVSDNCRWSAPEMFEEQATVSAKCDIYSFGMTILQLFTHEKPYTNKKTAQVFSEKQTGELPDRPQDERVVSRGLDDRIWKLLCQCWSKNPTDRPSIEELLAEF